MADNLSGTPETEYSVFDFSGGLNVASSNSILLDKESSDLLNISLSDRGKIKKRDGLVINTHFSLPNKVGVEVKGIFSFVQINGVRQDILYYGDKEMYATHTETGSWMKIDFFEAKELTPWTYYDPTTSPATEEVAGTYEYIPYTVQGERFTFFIFQMPDETTGVGENRLYMTNSKDGVFRLINYKDPDTGVYSLLARQIPTLPKCDYVAIRRNRAFYAGDPNNKDSVYFSYNLNPERIDLYVSGVALEQNTDNGGGGILRFPTSPDIEITGIVNFKDYLIVLKSDSAHVLSGRIPKIDFQIDQLDVASGCTSPRSIVRGNNAVYYKSDDGIRYIHSPSQDVIETKPLSEPINPEFDTVNDRDIHATFAKGKLYFFCSGDDPKTFVFDEVIKAWTKYDWNSGASFNDKDTDSLLIGGKNGYVFHTDKVLKDEVTPGVYAPINAYYSTPFHAFKEPQVTKRFRYLMVFFKPNPIPDSIVDLKIEIDYKDSYKEIDAEYISMVWGQGVWGQAHWGVMKQQVNQMVRFGGTGKSARFTFSNDKIDEDLEIHGFVAGYKRKKRRR